MKKIFEVKKGIEWGPGGMAVAAFLYGIAMIEAGAVLLVGGGAASPAVD